MSGYCRVVCQFTVMRHGSGKSCFQFSPLLKNFVQFST